MNAQPGRSSWRLVACAAALVLAVTALSSGAEVAGAAEFGLVPESVFVGTCAAPINEVSCTPADPPDTQAGAHPDLTTSFTFEQEPPTIPVGSVKDIHLDLPPGLIGNPTAAPRCSMFDVERRLCPPDSAVGVATLYIGRPGLKGLSVKAVTLVYNIVPYPDEPAAFGFYALFPVRLDASVRSATDFGVHVAAKDITEADTIQSSSVTLWGVPAEHNGPGPYETNEENPNTGEDITYGGKGGGVPLPFLTNPSSCGGSLGATLAADSWQQPGGMDPLGLPDLADPHWLQYAATLAPVTGCNELTFEPSIDVRPETLGAGGPSGYEVDLRVPQSENPSGLATPDLRDAVVNLPAGTNISPSAANGLAGCTHTAEPGRPGGQFALHSGVAAECPSSAQIGSVKIATPLLSEPLEGQAFLGQPECSPCDALDAESGRMLPLLLQVRGAGVTIKLAGSVQVGGGGLHSAEAHLAYGQLRAVFSEQPQLPFSELTMRINGGSQAPLANAPTCTAPEQGSAALTPYSASQPAIAMSRPFSFTGCASAAFGPTMQAGMTTTGDAGAYSSFAFDLSRADRDQYLSGIRLETPPGLLGRLSSVSLCGEPQADEGACPSTSLIGTTTVASGPGQAPVWLTPGAVYLTGPYRGAPFGLSIVQPATAGPFNLGNVIVRAAINVDRYTSALTVTSDPLPQDLDGIPLALQTIDVQINRPDFIFNPTNCNAMAITATITSAGGASAPLSTPFQSTNCALLPFKPRFTAITQAATSRVGGASLHVKVVAGPGGANIAKVRVDLPKQLPSRLTTLQKACPDSTFNADPATCPAASTVGTATATTPILKSPLTGPAYLVSHAGAAFPDLVIVLQGEGIVLYLVGNTDIKHGVTTSTFNALPDAPVSTFDLVLPQGPHSALAAYLAPKAHGSLCGQSLAMPTRITAQNGDVVTQTTTIGVAGCPRHKRRKASRARRVHRGSAPRKGGSR
jgi:hypothetical protein